jgi:diguanylate cyclase (GGDEF)-like protein
MRILIAEDEPSLRQNLQWMLEMEGFEVTTAVNGRDGFEQACRIRPDLVITDVMMPELDGYGLVKALREHPDTAAVPIIMLSAKADRGDIRTGMNLGADDYLTKPYRREELLETVRARLERSSKLETAARHLLASTNPDSALDPLTELPNREFFDQKIALSLSHCDPQDKVAVICFGIDGFTKVNDSLGKSVGNLVLREVAKRIAERVSETETRLGPHDAACRLGGDLFAICLSSSFETRSLENIAGDYLALLALPYLVEGHTLFLSACAGASIQPSQANGTNSLLIHAESALYHSKAEGPGTYQLFDSAMTQQVKRKLIIHNELHRAIEQEDLQVFYQPQVLIQTGALVGFEALARWQHPTLGWISPAEFIPIAEESGIIVKLGEWVMQTAATQAAQWIAQGHHGFRMAVNLSVKQFAGQKLPDVVHRVLTTTKLPAHFLELEITESLALQNITETLGTLHACKALGVKLAMDDFGTGYSSLAYLKRYPLDALKIDQSFVRNITQDAGDAAITRAIVAMAHSFGMSVIAEGVETVEQLEFLRNLGCEEFQGYLFSRPVDAAQAVKCFGGFMA